MFKSAFHVVRLYSGNETEMGDLIKEVIWVSTDMLEKHHGDGAKGTEIWYTIVEVSLEHKES